MKLAVFSPRPPSSSGIADYVAEQLPALARHHEVVPVGPGDAAPEGALRVYHLGNSPEHGYVLHAACDVPGVAVMHEWNLHHLVLHETLERGDRAAYLREMRRAWGERGTFAGRQIARGLGGELLPSLFALNDRARGVTVNVGQIDGGLRPNVIAAEARAEIDVRVPTMDAAREVEAALRALEPVGDDVEVEVAGGFGRLPLEPTPRNRALWHAARAAGGELGLALEDAAVGGASDANITSIHTATLDGLGPLGDGAHAPDEHVVAASLPERAALLALLVLLPAELEPV